MGIHIFLIFDPKHTGDCGYSLEPPRYSVCTHNVCVLTMYLLSENIKKKKSKIFQ